jgi:hypothetical protein
MAGSQYYFAAQTTGMPGSGFAPPVAVLGRGGQLRPTPEPLQVLTTLEDVRAANRRALSMAQRLVSIYTSDLEPKLYEHEPFLDVVQRFLLAHSFAKIRLLTQRSVPYTTPHKLAAMRRRLSGHIEVRCVAPQFAARTQTMLIADNRAIVYRAQPASYEGVAGFEQPPIAKLYLNEFDEMWLASAPKY